MTYKQIEASREVRLWIGQVIVPAIMGAGAVIAIPGVRESITKKFADIKEKANDKFHKSKIHIVK